MNLRASIVTIVDNDNFGNRLQNYALQQALKKVGFESVRTLFFSGSMPRDRYGIGGFLRAFRHRFVSRWCLFERFTREMIPTERVSLDQLRATTDVLFAGSDQIWNPYYHYGARLDGTQFLYDLKAPVRASYAASFGVDGQDIAHDWIERYSRWLPKLDFLSVREFSGKEICDLAGVSSAVVHVDPTMLLSAEEWSAIEREPKEFALGDSSFCLKYVLGESYADAAIENVASANGLRVVDISMRQHAVGPREFLWLIRNADLVCTDSYHAVVFSLLFHRSFTVFERKDGDMSMAGRFLTLVELFSLNAGHFVGDFEFRPTEVDEDWVLFEHKLAALRGEAFDYLTDVARAAKAVS